MGEMLELQTGELFAGAGGLGLGFLLAGHPQVRYRPAFAIDNDALAVKSHTTNMTWLAKHMPDVLPKIPKLFNRDVEELDVIALLRLLKLEPGDLDLLLGGPPCQGFSNSNRKSTNKEDRNRLVKVFLDQLDKFKPKMFLLENVQGVRWTKPTRDMSAAPVQGTLFPEEVVVPASVQEFLVHKATTSGYRVWHGVLDAVNFGVPQHRMRFFLFGIRCDLVPAGEVTLAPYLNQRVVTERISVNRAIGDLPSLTNGEWWAGDEYYPSDDDYVTKMRQYMQNGDLHDHFATKHADYVIDRYKLIPEGGNWESIKEHMANYAIVDNTHSNIYRRLKGDMPAHTISHYRKSMIIHPSQHRGLSMREACRLQSFPDWFRFEGGSDHQQQQLANAVPPLMAAAVAWAIGERWSNCTGAGRSLTESSPSAQITRRSV